MRTTTRSLSFLVTILAIASSEMACGGDDGRPGAGAGTGGGRGDGSGDGTGSGTTEDEKTPTTEADPVSPAPAAPDGAKKANGEGPCASDGECASSVCFSGNTQSYCSVKCTVDDAATTCAAPFTGSCNKQGFCKRD